MRLNINITPDKEDLYWKLAELKVRYKASSWLDLLEIMIDIVNRLEYGSED